ncbi:hypothetical protein CAI16_18815 [Virgibacillus dokdonensis]|uniref:DUF4357 domain-containing protein n=2 Tax=Bacillales TaxID=1385 RepID=A0A3E0WH28_9BACI|nr:hypothetical protein CAI16_18815 [Virgibacillus dokdonensis]
MIPRIQILKDDYIFSSPSAAAALVMVRNVNALTAWKLKNGNTLKEYDKLNKKQEK